MTHPVSPILRLGTRRSPLAMAQATEARARLCAAHGWDEDAVELVPVIASGDRIQDRPLADLGGKALWTPCLSYSAQTLALFFFKGLTFKNHSPHPI